MMTTAPPVQWMSGVFFSVGGVLWVFFCLVVVFFKKKTLLLGK